MENQIISKSSFYRITGLLYLLIAIIGGFSIAYMPSVVFGDISADDIILSINEKFSLFRAGILGDLLVVIMELMLSVMLYQIFKIADKSKAMIASFSRLSMTIVMAINLVLYFMVLKQSMDISSATERGDGVIQLLWAHKIGELIWQSFFAIHMFFLGLLLLNKIRLLKVIGVLILLGSAGYMMDAMLRLFIMDNTTMQGIANVLLAAAVLGELAFTFYLLIKGELPDE